MANVLEGNMRDLDAALAGNISKGLKREEKSAEVNLSLEAALNDAWTPKDYVPEAYRFIPRIPRSAWHVAMQAIAAAHVTRISAEYSALMNHRCQSPVEELMFVSLALCTATMYTTDFYDFSFRAPSAFYPGPTCCGGALTQERHVHVCPQHSSGQIHVDFLVTMVDGPVPVVAQDGKTIAGTSWPSARVMVECDGHDFHEKTKEQARRDKKRDRELQKLGFHVLRYTGSEVWSDPVGCANEVLAFLRKRLGFKERDSSS